MTSIEKKAKEYCKENFEGWENPDIIEMVADTYETACRMQNAEIINRINKYCKEHWIDTPTIETMKTVADIKDIIKNTENNIVFNAD